MNAVKTISDKIISNISRVLYGKENELRLITAAYIAGGHVLLEDLPGLGKTTAARALAASVSGSYKRIQFTPDLLPSDITGINYYNSAEGRFVFRPGPVFANIVIADEINRATPRTQSALLECMAEGQVTVDAVTHRLDEPYLIIATENPVESQGVFPLPEAQRDRFMIKLSLGYPSPGAEKQMLDRVPGESTSLAPVCSCDDILAARSEAEKIQVSDKIKEYIVRIANESRKSPALSLGVSPRASLALLGCARAWAAMDGREYVLPDDIKALCVPVLAHRVIPSRRTNILSSASGEEVIRSILDAVPSPVD